MADVHFDLSQTTSPDLLKELCAMQGAVAIVVKLIEREGILGADDYNIRRIIFHAKQQLLSDDEPAEPSE